MAHCVVNLPCHCQQLQPDASFDLFFLKPESGDTSIDDDQVSIKAKAQRNGARIQFRSRVATGARELKTEQVVLCRLWTLSANDLESAASCSCSRTPSRSRALACLRRPPAEYVCAVTFETIR
jgi:hypothetical protein